MSKFAIIAALLAVAFVAAPAAAQDYYEDYDYSYQPNYDPNEVQWPPTPVEPQGEAGFMEPFTYESGSGFTVAPTITSPCCIDAPQDTYVGGGAIVTY